MTDSCELSLGLACYNEAEHFESSVRRIVRVLDDTRLTYEIIFVDDCSADRTPRLIQQVRNEFPDKDITTLFHAANTGRGGAVSDGFRAAKGAIVGYIDIDL
jgi:glycosyltransferase involved in cell wall biosynthesis